MAALSSARDLDARRAAGAGAVGAARAGVREPSRGRVGPERGSIEQRGDETGDERSQWGNPMQRTSTSIGAYEAWDLTDPAPGGLFSGRGRAKAVSEGAGQGSGRT